MSFVRSALVLCAALAATSGYALSDTDIIFHLFTRTNTEQSEPLLSNVASIMASSFDISKRTVFTIHNHEESSAGNFNAFVVPGWLRSEDVNVIAVDWTVSSAFYTEGLANAPQVGEIIANFINILSSNFGYSSSQIRFVGVGLGAHIAGIAARKADGVFPHIVALDPSLVGWTHHPDILNADDADIVEVLHTTAGYTGFDEPIGDLDFYPNGGSYMNGCGTDLSCSYIYAYAYYTESLDAEQEDNQFVGTACESYEQAISRQCSGDRDAVFGGTGTKSGTSGIYSFETNAVPPFARG